MRNAALGRRFRFKVCRTTAWPAARELRLEGFVEAPIGVALIVGALASGASVVLVIGAVAVLLVAAAYPLGWQRKMLAGIETMPLGAVPATRAQMMFRRAPLAVASAICLTCLAWISPLTMGLCGAVLVGCAAVSFVRAWAISSWKRSHEARVVRVPEDLIERDRYFVAL